MHHCKKCGACCKWEGESYVTRKEVERIAAHLEMPLDDFVKAHVKTDYHPRLALKLRESGACMFLRDNLCGIYPARPRQCGDFPLKWAVADVEKLCPGITVLEEDS